MANREQNSKITTWAAVDTTLGGVGLVGISYTGSAATSTITVLDNTAIKMVIPVASTQAFTFFEFYPPVAFANLVIDATGTGSFSVMFVPRP